MNYTEYVAKIITKVIGGKVLFRNKDELLVQGIIVLDGTTVDDEISSLNNLDKQLVKAHKTWIAKLIKRYPELSEIFTKDTIDSIKYTSDYDLSRHSSKQVWPGDSAHYTKWLSVFTDEETPEYDYSLVPKLNVGFACQDYHSQFWEDEPVMTVYFQVEVSPFESSDLEDWLKDKGVSSADILSI